MGRRAHHLPRAGVACVGLALLWGGCGDGGWIGFWEGPLTAYCTVPVDGRGTKAVETDYLPHVVACENGSADTEALKAQAVASRSYMYYRVNRSGSICDSQACQVYTCSRKPDATHYAAVSATAGQVLRWGGVTVCTFYVAGARPRTSSCKGDLADHYTEKYVTYNFGKTGSAVTQSILGWVHPSNKYNRGCKSQNGAHCLSLQGWKYPDILRFYYGSDIVLETAKGSCIKPPPVDGGPPEPDSRPLPAADSRPPQSDSPVTPGRDLPATAESGPPVYPGAPQQVLQGGCSWSATPDPVPGPLLLVLAVVLGAVLRRRSA
jgi:MYXO-CTERM domain-containing protein